MKLVVISFVLSPFFVTKSHTVGMKECRYYLHNNLPSELFITQFEIHIVITEVITFRNSPNLSDKCFHVFLELHAWLAKLFRKLGKQIWYVFLYQNGFHLILYFIFRHLDEMKTITWQAIQTLINISTFSPAVVRTCNLYKQSC